VADEVEGVVAPAVQHFDYVVFGVVRAQNHGLQMA
jgi:hypothetical protein